MNEYEFAVLAFAKVPNLKANHNKSAKPVT